MKSLVRVLVLLGVLVLIVDFGPDMLAESEGFAPTLDEVRPYAYAMTVFFAVSAVTLLIVVGHEAGRALVAIHASLGIIGWLPFAVSAAGLLLLFVPELAGESMPWALRPRVVESVIPLVLGIQAAMLFAPDEEPALEVLLALPRPPVWVVLERLALVLVCQLVLGTVGAVIAALLLPDADLAVTLLRWLPPALLLGGAGLYATVRARVVVFGVMLVVLLWGVTMLFGDLLVPGQPVFYPLNLIQPFLWPVVPYLQPETLPMGDYWLNRLCVGAAGLVLMLLALWSLRDEERVLLGEQTIEERIRQR